MAFELDEVIFHLSKMIEGRFYGSLEIMFEGGQITVCKKLETIKPNDNGKIEILQPST